VNNPEPPTVVGSAGGSPLRFLQGWVVTTSDASHLKPKPSTHSVAPPLAPKRAVRHDPDRDLLFTPIQRTTSKSHDLGKRGNPALAKTARMATLTFFLLNLAYNGWAPAARELKNDSQSVQRRQTGDETRAAQGKFMNVVGLTEKIQ
jgi:hypothetical protein